MTSAEEYVQKRAEAVELIQKHAPTRLQDALIALLRPAIALCATRADDSQISLGASKFGGAPDVPPNFEWPMWNDHPLGFLAQINMEEVAPFDVEELLPKGGVLSFFYDWQEQPWGYDPKHKGGWGVIWIASPTKRSAETAEVDTQKLSFDAQWTLRGTEDEEIYTILNEAKHEAKDENSFRRFYDLERTLRKSSDYLLGWPIVIQNPMEWECQLVSNGIYCGGAGFYDTEEAQQLKAGAADWILLAQFEFDEVIDGRLYFWIRRQDLQARNFADVWFCFQTT